MPAGHAAGSAVVPNTALTPEQVRTAMSDPEFLKRWLEASGRSWLVFNARDLVNGLPWPDGHDAFLQILSAYRSERAAQETGRFETQEHPTTHELVQIPIVKTEILEVEELDRVIRYLIVLMLEQRPTWRLEDPAL